jgi:esterase
MRRTLLRAAFSTSATRSAPVRMDAIVMQSASTAGDVRHRLVVLHGLFGSNGNWRQLAHQWVARAASSVEVHLLSARNHGRSGHSDTMTYAAMASDTLAYVAALAPCANTVLLGHSMGAKTAMYMALAQPHAVSRVVVADMVPTTYADFAAHVAYARAMRDLDLQQLRSRADIERHLALAVPDRPTRAFLMTNLARVDENDGNSGFRWLLNIDLLSRDYVLETLRAWPETHQFAPFAGPVLFLRGGKSNYVSDAAFEAAKRTLFPNAVLSTVAGAGHWLHAEKPADVVSAVESFAFH